MQANRGADVAKTCQLNSSRAQTKKRRTRPGSGKARWAPFVMHIFKCHRLNVLSGYAAPCGSTISPFPCSQPNVPSTSAIHTYNATYCAVYKLIYVVQEVR